MVSLSPQSLSFSSACLSHGSNPLREMRRRKGMRIRKAHVHVYSALSIRFGTAGAPAGILL